MFACVVVVLLLCGRTLLKNPYRASLLLLLQMIWCNANRYPPWLWNLFPQRSCCCIINWIPSQCIGSIPRISFILPLTLSSVWMFISPNLMLLLGKTKYHANLYLVITIGGHKAYMEIKQESPAQLSLAIRLCSLVLCFDLLITSLLVPNLVTTFACYPSFA